MDNSLTGKIDINKLILNMSRLGTSTAKTTKETNDLTTALKNNIEAMGGVVDETIKLEKYKKQGSTTTIEMTNALNQKIKAQIKEKENTKEVTAAVTTNINASKKSTVAVKENAQAADKLSYSWKKAFSSFSMYLSVTTVFYAGINAIKDMVSEVTNLDKSLTELQKVTDLSGDSLDNYVKKAYSVGEGLAKTGKDVIEASTEFAKAGYDENTSMELGRVALMYTNIADEAVEASESANMLISVMKAFNLEAGDTTHIIDSINEVANKFAVSSSDIAENVGKSSAVMAGAGNTWEQTIGLLTAGTEITRNASKVSNGKKTKPCAYSNMRIRIIPNPVIPKALIATT